MNAPAPPGAAHHPTSGGSTSAEASGQTEEAIRITHAILANCGLEMAPSKVSRIVRRYEHRISGSGTFTFIDYLTSQVQVSSEQRRQILNDPEVRRIFRYRDDPTGEDAVRHVLRERGY